MRSHPCTILTLLALGLAGCGSGGPSPLIPKAPAPPPTPGVAPPATSVAAALGGVATHAGVADSALAIYDLTLDPISLNAVANLHETRAGQASGDLFVLPVDQFFGAGDFEVLGISWRSESVDVQYAIHHPFAAPSDLAAPSTGLNRADLGFAGMVLLLADVPTTTGNTYFTDVVANTSLVTNADAYFRPAGLLDVNGNANTFPYKVLVDERGPAGSRLGISNAGDPRGNFGTDGWTSANIGSNRVSWTGYGVMHQGQTTLNTFSFDPAVLGTAPITFQIAVIARWADPVGGSPRSLHRLPPATPNLADFGYRMPHGALDCERIEYLGESGGFQTNIASSSFLRFRITDWDARGQQTTSTQLSDDLDPSHVAIGEAGLPAIQLSIPGVIGDIDAIQAWDPLTALDGNDTPYGGDPSVDSGAPGDGLFFIHDVLSAPGACVTPGDYSGMVRTVDPQTSWGTSPTTYLDSALRPLADADPSTYQAFQVTVLSDDLPPTATILGPATLESGTHPWIEISEIDDPQFDEVSVEVAWDGINYVFIRNIETPYPGILRPVEVTPRINPNPAPAQEYIRVRLRELQRDHLETILESPYELGANHPPTLSGNARFPIVSQRPGGSFSIRLPETISDIEGDPVTPVAYLRPDPSTPLGTWEPPNITGLGPFPDYGDYPFDVYLTDPAHPDQATATKLAGPFVGTIRWMRTAVWQGNMQAAGAVLGPDGSQYVLAWTRGWMDADPGLGEALQNLPYGSLSLFKLDSSGQFVWVRVLPLNSVYELSASLLGNPDGSLAIASSFDGTVDFDPGPGEEMRTGDGYDCFEVTLDSAGNLVDLWTWGGEYAEWMAAAASNAAGQHVVLGRFNGTVDFDPGPGTAILSHQNPDQMFLLRRSPGSSLDWVTAFDDQPQNIWNEIPAVTLDDSGDAAILMDWHQTLDFAPGPQEVFSTSSQPKATALVQFSPTGAFAGFQRWDFEFAGSFAHDHAGNPVVQGYFGGDADLDPGPGISFDHAANGYIPFLALFDPSFAFQRAITFLRDENNAGRLFVTPGVDGGWVVAGELGIAGASRKQGCVQLTANGELEWGNYWTGGGSYPSGELFVLTPSDGRTLVAGSGTDTNLDIGPGDAYLPILDEYGNKSGGAYVTEFDTEGRW
ncbi:MAG: hypothetical protein ABI743_05900 [bacterium]